MKSHSPIIAVLVLLLTLSVAANAILYRKASRTLFEEGQRPLIERTVALFASRGQSSAAEIKAETFSIVMHHGHRTCVELRRYDGLGHQGACYDLSGKIVEEIEGVRN